MSLSNRSCENCPPFFLSPRLANTLNHSQFVFGMLDHSQSKLIMAREALVLLFLIDRVAEPVLDIRFLLF